MKEIKEITRLIDEEICDAKKYAKLALQYKDENPDLAGLYNNLSIEEMRHMNMLHDMVTKIIRAVEKSQPIPEGMKLAYDYLHELSIEKAAEVTVLQSMYR